VLAVTETVDVRLVEMAREQEHVDRVYERWQTTRAEVRTVEVEGNRRGRAGANPGALYERDVLAYHAARRMLALDNAHEGLVFGRLDLTGGEVRHVGRVGLRDDAYEPLVVDWRAPAAAPFYRATAEDPTGVVRRRVIRCVGAKVIAVEDDLLDPEAAPEGMPIVGEGALMASLSRSRDGSMHDIVATIQHEQDLVIRAPASGVTLLSGGPGTGKTVVALHRAAYLLYTNRRRFEAGGVLVVGPSPVFIDYIERVLPALGENAATLRSLGGLVEDVATDRHDDAAVAAVKGSLRMLGVLERAARDTPPGAPDRLRIVYRGEVLELHHGELERIRRTVLARNAGRNGQVNLARRHAADALLTALWGEARRRIADRMRPERPDFDEDIRDRSAFGDFVVAWWPELTPAGVLGWAADRDRLARYAGDTLTPAEVDLLARSWAEGVSAAAPSVEDVALLDELDALLGTAPITPTHRNRPEDDEYRELTTFADRSAAARRTPERDGPYEEYAHIIVDEAQDVSPMQWRMLGRRGQYASWTIVGDPMQSAWGDPAEAARARDEALNTRVRHEFRLSTNYRNPAEIFAVAERVIRHELPDADLPRAVRSIGVQPSHRVAPDVRAEVTAAVAELRGDLEGLLAVVTPMDRVTEVRGWLGDDPRVRVVGSLDSKGMEYDGVVIVEPGDIVGESPSGVATLYVALTRATQRLVTVARDGAWLERFGL
jgi:hypothetical protein